MLPEKGAPGMKDWNELMRPLGTRQDIPMKPQAPAYELGLRLSILVGYLE